MSRRRTRRRGGRIILVALAVVLALGLIALGVFWLMGREPPPEDVPNPIATITMQDGQVMRIELRPDVAPNTVANFVKLANDGFYDGDKQWFFRVVAGVFIQAGDPENNGTGDPGYAIKGEFAENGVENSLSHLRGVISMARPSGYDTAGSQFFIMQGSYPEYDGRYAAFGTLMDAESLATLDAIASQPVDSNYLPLTRQIISSIRVETFGAEYEPETLAREKTN